MMNNYILSHTPAATIYMYDTHTHTHTHTHTPLDAGMRIHELKVSGFNLEGV
jgi:hypothetical protein